MNAIFKKELRGLQSPFLITVGIIAMGLFGNLRLNFSPSFAGFSITAFGACCLLIGASAFGGEFQTRTMGILLAQPISRRRVWFLKLGALTVTLAVAFLLMWLSQDYLMRRFWLNEELPNILQVFSIMPWLLFGILCTLPFYTLAMRNTLSGLVVAFVLPSVSYGLLVLAGAITERFTGVTLEQFQDTVNKRGREIFIAYCALIYWLGYRRFLNHEEIDSKGKEIKLPTGLREALTPVVNAFKPGYSSPIKSLVRKELELQRGIFIIAATVFIMLACEMIAWKMHPVESIGVVIAVTLFCYTMLAATVTGVTSVAEERHLWTMAWQLTLPVSRRTQWWVKFSVALTIWLVMGVALPCIWVAIGKAMMGFPDDFVNGFYRSLSIFLSGFLLSLFASSISNNSMRATLTSIAFAAVCGSVFISRFLDRSHDQGSDSPLGALLGWLFTYFPAYAIVPIIISGFAGGMVVLIIYLAGANFQRNESSSARNWLQAVLIVGIIYASAPVIRVGLLVARGQERTFSDYTPPLSFHRNFKPQPGNEP